MPVMSLPLCVICRQPDYMGRDRGFGGEEEAQRLEVNGDDHGLLAHIVRSIQEMSDYETPHVRRHEQELLAGHFGIGVTI